ncbi:hypothetical protein [Ensifer adhaerens]|uniref:hypothetical protein n=1 Tax=Ensifer adhaerens TaxID=106592 RepID=UPI00098EFE97|nr:hypothetical protein [Ensifer adhaerens]
MQEQQEDDEFSYYRADDLINRRIVKSRVEVCRLVRTSGFPPPVKMGDSMQSGALYPRREVHAWLRARAARRRKTETAE